MNRTATLLGAALTLLAAGIAAPAGSGGRAMSEELPRPSGGRAYQTLALPGGGSLRYALVLPDGFDPKKRYPLLVALPPGDQGEQMVEVALSLYWEAQAKKGGWILASPIAPDGSGFADPAASAGAGSGADSRPDPVVTLANDLMARYTIEGEKFHLAGVSNGGRAAFRIAIAHPEKIASLTVLPGLVDAEVDRGRLDRLRGIPVAMYVGERDADWRDGMKDLSRSLTAAGVANTLEIAAGQDHVIRNLSMSALFGKLDAARKR
jgi:poly(3-hydroxybutyrate) depolymerase